MNLTRRNSLRLVIVGGGATLIAACSAPAASPAATQAAAPQPAVAAATQAPAQTSPVKFRVDESSDLASLNPLLFNSTPTRRRAVQMFSGLYQYDLKNNLAPDLA